jgi:hypothetical protein
MRPRFLVTRGLATTTLALAAAALLATLLASNEPRSAPGPDAAGDGSAPPQACTLVGCADGLAVALESGSTWPDGTYRFEIEADDVHVMCRAALPVPPCNGSTEIPPISSVACDPSGVVQIVESGCALRHLAASPVTEGFPAILFDPRLRPQRVEIAVSWNGKLVGHKQFAPRFEKLQPNGPACPPTCDVARSTMALEF